MTKIKLLANGILFIHCIVLAIVLFGWLVPKLWPFYMATLLGTLVFELALGYCVLSKWEFALRKKIDPQTDYDYSFSSFYTHKLTQNHLSMKFFQVAATFFLVASLGLNIYFKF